jgi:hypothetical protein
MICHDGSHQNHQNCMAMTSHMVDANLKNHWHDCAFLGMVNAKRADILNRIPIDFLREHHGYVSTTFNTVK